MLLGVTHLHSEMSLPPRVETDDPLPSEAPKTPWFSKLKARRVTLNQTKKKMREQCMFKAPKKKRRTATATATHTHQKKAQALLSTPLTYATKMEAIKVLSNLPQTTTALRVQLERHLGHRREDLPLPKEVGQALSHAMEERRTMANTFLQNRHYAWGIHRNMLRLMKHGIREYTTYEHQVKRLYLTAVRSTHGGRVFAPRVPTSLPSRISP